MNVDEDGGFLNFKLEITFFPPAKIKMRNQLNLVLTRAGARGNLSARFCVEQTGSLGHPWRAALGSCLALIVDTYHPQSWWHKAGAWSPMLCTRSRLQLEAHDSSLCKEAGSFLLHGCEDAGKHAGHTRLLR